MEPQRAQGPSEAPECKLLSGSAAICAQVVLLFLVLGSLFYKRQKEEPRRPVNVFCLDVSKQAFSSGAAHICGMLIAIVAHFSTAGFSPSECAWYFVVFSLDTSLGVALAITFHKFMLRACRQWGESGRKRSGLALAIAECGEYGSPVELWRWGAQMVVWVIATIGARLICGALVLLTAGGLKYVALLLDIMFKGYPTLLLFFVMVACPLGMNLIQAWIQDAFLKHRATREGGWSSLDGYDRIS
uniref:Uncharacterized protein n=1 Tax=Tetraselmis chuii TaxID=63592 RepID=A0A7S1SNL5_9CHLO|mmetsp:Transcript_20897/g.37293  ORF Transcript_20897/g.37293 Transcript_20897/m.37293 type:complete len:244 (+) Transcript_20897:185-916(+)